MANAPTGGLLSEYYDRDLVDRQVARGNHRGITGGKWDFLGKLQLSFLVGNGLKPGHMLLDVGCGALRGGLHAVGYLEPAHYFGVDLNQSLIDAGYDREIAPAGPGGKAAAFQSRLQRRVRVSVERAIRFCHRAIPFHASAVQFHTLLLGAARADDARRRAFLCHLSRGARRRRSDAAA
ncbi:MAG: hypothetical protein WDN03_08130 [Rhizomicrobium sp.]